MIYENLLKDIQIPEFYKIRQKLDRQKISDVTKEVRRQMMISGVLKTVKKGDRIAVTAGSREITDYARILKTVCDVLKEHGACPFVIPAMGSHGGAVAENQKALIAHFGITEEKMKVPILSGMDVISLGRTPGGVPVYFDKYAGMADGIIPVGRIKIHTCFRGEIESGLMKMLAVGCGKQRGAAAMHKNGFSSMSKNVTEAARVCLEKLPVLFGVGILENACHETRQIAVLPAGDIEREEKKLLETARQTAPRIPFDKVNVLIVDEMGKNISGTGMDPNITGRSSPLGTFCPFVDQLAVLDLTQESDGSAYGVGNADVITRRLFEKIIMENTYPNGITNRDGKPMMIPPVMPDDKTAIRFALGMLTGEALQEKTKIVWIHNTLQMEEFYISGSLLGAAMENTQLTVDPEPFQVVFDKEGNVAAFQ